MTELSGIDNDAVRRATRWLSSAGLRPTRQRRAIAALLVGDGRDRHVTAEALFAAVKETDEPVSLATVYNTLRCFTSAGLLSEIAVVGARSYFDTRVDERPHFHFYHQEDGSLTDAPSDNLDAVSPPEGYEIASVDVVIRLRRKR